MNYPQSLEKADLLQRTIAYIIDLIIIAFIIGIIFPFNLDSNFDFSNYSLSWEIFLATTGITLLYFVLWSSLNHGQTLGQFCVKIRLIDEKKLDYKITFLQCVLHSFGKILPVIPVDLFVGFILSRKKGEYKRFFQIIAQTQVIESKFSLKN